MYFKKSIKYLILLILFFAVIKNYALSPQIQIDSADSHYRSEINNTRTIDFINKNYPGYRIYEFCSQHFTQFKKKEYLLTLLSINHKIIKYLLLTKKEKTKSYSIRNFGSHELSSDTEWWQNTKCGTSGEALVRWKSRDPEIDKWNKEPTENDFDYFCVIRDDAKSLYTAYTCYQYDIKTKTFPILSINYVTDG